MEEVIVKTFPKNECEALAMLYVQNQDLSGLSPTDLLAMYQDAYEAIWERLEEQYSARYPVI